MKDRVKIVRLNNVTLDIEELTNDDCQGRCRKLVVRGDTRTRYRDKLREWAAQAGWTLSCLTTDTKCPIFTKLFDIYRISYLHNHTGTGCWVEA